MCSVDIMSSRSGGGGGRGVNDALIGETDGVALNGVDGALGLTTSKSDIHELGLAVATGSDVDVFSMGSRFPWVVLIADDVVIDCVFINRPNASLAGLEIRVIFPASSAMYKPSVLCPE